VYVSDFNHSTGLDSYRISMPSGYILPTVESTSEAFQVLLMSQNDNSRQSIRFDGWSFVDSTGLEHKLLSIIVHFVPILLSTREPDSTVAEPHVSVFQVLA